MSEATSVERYEAAAHAIQSGVATEMERQPPGAMGPTSPKHLRVGLELRACDHAALVRLLIEKGIITEAEYLEAIADEAEREKARYEERISQALGGVKITLG